MLIPDVQLPDSYRKSLERAHSITQEILGILETKGTVREIEGATNVSELLGAHHIFVISGYLNLMHKEQNIVTYSAGDVAYIAPPESNTETEIRADFASKVLAIPASDIALILKDNPTALPLWVEINQIFQSVLTYTYAVVTRVPPRPKSKFRHYNTGDTIIEVGEKADSVFFMLSGAAQVILEGKEVGTIGADELFGEMSFLADTDRTATVIATSKCQVQVTARHEFESLVEGSPYLLIEIAQRLVKRICELDQKIIRL
ncbi:MAG: cyclic nucleotide-binding domain-containing protein [Myxococcota bacterium]|nr:cyclic nucleotide-binding domain-containing protein [Myxococcota bacterium]